MSDSSCLVNVEVSFVFKLLAVEEYVSFSLPSSIRTATALQMYISVDEKKKLIRRSYDYARPSSICGTQEVNSAHMVLLRRPESRLDSLMLI